MRDCDGEQKTEKNKNEKELPSLSRNSMSMGLRISLFASDCSLGGSGRLVVVFNPHMLGVLLSSFDLNYF